MENKIIVVALVVLPDYCTFGELFVVAVTLLYSLL